MVITAREQARTEQEILNRRNEQLKSQLEDAESLLKSHQAQLADLKHVMEQMTSERDDQTNPTAPSTPALSKFDVKDTLGHAFDTMDGSAPDTVSPSYPTSFTHLLHPILRTDLAAFEEFTSLLHMSKNIVAGSRVSSGSYGGLGLGLGLGSYTNPSQTGLTPHNNSTSSISTSGTFSSTPATPTTPVSSSSASSTNGPNSLTPLKETKFYKRALAEDIEPTMRLDTAPGLSWLARRTVLNSMGEGTMVVEPMPASSKLYIFACALCGETRKSGDYNRTHRFRTSESESAQRYPLCKYCLGRVRSSCDFLGFLRTLKDGHWRADSEDAEKAAWEESVRLREQMFWCRIGGGVIPAPGHQIHGSSGLGRDRTPRSSEEERRAEEQMHLSIELEKTGELIPRDVTPITPVDITVKSVESALGEAWNLHPKKAPVSGRRYVERVSASAGLWKGAQEDAQAPLANDHIHTQAALGPLPEENSAGAAKDIVPANAAFQQEGTTDEVDVVTEESAGLPDMSAEAPASSLATDEAMDEKRLSITIPGAFD